MPTLSQPELLPGPFAYNGDKNDIPDASASLGAASYQQGFPPITQLPVNAGGIPPQRNDFNGILNALSQHTFWQQSGGMYSWSATLDYAVPSMVVGSDKEIYFALQPSGPGTPAGAKNPTSGAGKAYWQNIAYVLPVATATKLGGVMVNKGGLQVNAAGLLSLLLLQGGGLNLNASGQLYVDFSLVPPEQMRAIVLAMVQQGGGIAVDGKGKLYVDFASMPTDKFESMLKSIRVPIWVESTKPFYVNQATGSDTLDAGRGESPAKPFKTIQACIDYVTSNYNLNSHNIGVYIYPGIYNEQLRLGDYSRTTGYIALLDKEGEYGVTITSKNKHTIIASGGLWYLRGLVLKNEVSSIDDGIAHFLSVISASNCTLHLEGCDIQQEYTGDAPTNGNVYLRTIAAYGAGAVVQFDPTSKSRNRLCFHKGNATAMQTLFAERGGMIQCAASNSAQSYVTIYCEGETSDFLYLGNANFNNIGGAYYMTIFAVEPNKAVTGRRFRLAMGSMCSTGGKGPDFFPGDTAGTLEESTYCVYK